MKSLSLAPMEWSELKDIDDVEPLNEADTDCLTDIREVLRAHGKMDRFGVALLHSHFEISNDEIMVETCDEESRTLKTSPVKLDEADSNTDKVGTLWMLKDGDITTMNICQKYCYKYAFGHNKAHDKGE